MVSEEAVKQLQKHIEELQHELKSLRPRAAELERENEALSEQIAWFRRYFLHRKADVVEDKSQQALPFDEAEQLSQHSETKSKNLQIVGEHSRRRPVRRPLPEDLPRERQIIDIPEEEKQCACGHRMSRIGEEKSERLDIQPPRLRVIEQVRPKYACHACEGSGDEEKPAVRIAAVPSMLIPGGIATAGLLSYIVTAKFCDATPLYRQEKQFQRLGVDLPRQTMADWMIAAATASGPVYEALERVLRSGPAVLIDETRVQVLKEPGRPNTNDSFAWAAVGGKPEHPVVLFRYDPTRSGQVALDILGDYQGYVQSDGYAGYDWSLETLPGVVHVGCMAHVRRKFVDAANDGKNRASSNQALAVIAKIYAVEGELKGLTRDQEFLTQRQTRVQPLMDDLFAWIQTKATQVPPKSALGKAVSYALNQWAKVERYLESPHLTPDTNRVENAIRPFVLGRKNWLFSGSPRGAKSSMILYSLVETAKANKVEPYWYLRRLFEALPSFPPEGDFAELLPWNIHSRPIQTT